MVAIMVLIHVLSHQPVLHLHDLFILLVDDVQQQSWNIKIFIIITISSCCMLECYSGHVDSILMMRYHLVHEDNQRIHALLHPHLVVHLAADGLHALKELFVVLLVAEEVLSWTILLLPVVVFRRRRSPAVGVKGIQLFVCSRYLGQIAEQVCSHFPPDRSPGSARTCRGGCGRSKRI